MRILQITVFFAGLFVLSAGNPARAGQVEVQSTRNFEDTVNQLKWHIGGLGASVLLALDYRSMTRAQVSAVTLEVLRRKWAQAALQRDAGLASAFPFRIVVLQRGDAVVVIRDDLSSLREHADESVRKLGVEIDEKLGGAVRQASAAPTAGQ